MMLPTLLPGAESYFSRGESPQNRLGVLCLHGLNASPDEVRWLAQSLAEGGFTVYAPRLAGHGADPQMMRRIRWQDWYLSALDAYHVLKAQCDRVIVCGLSMGGLLTLLVGASQEVAGLAVMAAPLDLSQIKSMRYIGLIKRVRPTFDGTDRSDFVERLKAEQARRGESVRGRVRYDLWTTQSVQELKRLIQVVNAKLDQVRAPVLALYSESDLSVSPSNLTLLLKRLPHAHVESHVVQRSGHILTQDEDREDVIARVKEFVTSIALAEL